MTEEEIARERESVVGSALGWLGTAYHHMAEVRGAGADCVTFLHGAFRDARIEGLVLDPITHYPQDWHFHRDVERYMEGLTRYCTERPGPAERLPLPGDIVLFKFARAFSHGAIVLNFPLLIHSQKPRGVERVDLLSDSRLSVVYEKGPMQGLLRPLKVFTLTRWVS